MIAQIALDLRKKDKMSKGTAAEKYSYTMGNLLGKILKNSVQKSSERKDEL